MSNDFKSILYFVIFTIIIIFIAFIGFKPASYNLYVLDNGKEVKCMSANHGYCGVHLEECLDGMEYHCQVNVTQVTNK